MITKREARRLRLQTAEMGGQILQGRLTMGPDGLEIEGTNVLEWLAAYADAEVALMVAPVDDEGARGGGPLQSCHTCGRDYRGEVCPHCAEARARLRGRWS